MYKPRMADKLLAERLSSKGAVLIEGAKWCGKTTTAEQAAKSVLYLDDPARLQQNLQLAEVAPQQLLAGATPRLIDEWQLAPQLWDAVRFEVDHRPAFGQFILTGSAVPASDALIHHTGTGRFSRLLMRPMSLFESGESSGDVSLRHLFDTPEQIGGTSTVSIEELAFLVCRGGWPRATDMQGESALEQAFDYFEAVVRADVGRVKGAIRNPERIRQIMRVYARHQGTQTSETALGADLNDREGDNISRSSLYSCITALKQIFVIEEMAAWNPNLRSKTAVRTTNTRYFVDPSIACAALGVGPNDLIGDLNTFGFLFETLCVRDLRVFAEALHGAVYHFRDKNGLECDAVVHLRNGHYGLIEIKLGGAPAIEAGAETLLKLQSKLDLGRMRSPSFLMVLAGLETYAYRRKDGVYVVPIGCLGV